jgi:hypothetical protein
MALKKISNKKSVPSPDTAPPVKEKKVTRISPPTTAVVEAASAKPPKVSKTPKATRNVSKDEFLGRRMRIAEYQDYTLSINAGPKRRLTDVELCADWQAQFPNAVVFTPHHVRGVRRDYNVGRHSKAFSGKKDGATASVPYMVKDGKRLAAVIENAPAKSAAA